MQCEIFEPLQCLSLGGALFIASGNPAGAVSGSAGLSRIDGLSAIEFVQDKKKSETVKLKVKRIWRNMTGYKFVLQQRHVCRAFGKTRDSAISA